MPFFRVYTSIAIILLSFQALAISSVHASASHASGSWLGSPLEERLENLTGEGITAGNRLSLLIDGPEFYPRRLEMIRNARFTIDLLTFLWCDDESGLEIAKALGDAARRGVRVRVMVDAMNNKPHEQAYDILRRAGVRLLVFNPVYWGIHNILKRIHEKIMVVDGGVALVGGANLCDEYMLSTAARGLWKDLELSVEGPVISRIQNRIDGTWNWMARRENFAQTRPGLATRRLMPVYPSPTPVSARPGGDERAVFHYQQSYVRPDDDEKFIEAYALLIESARNRVIFYDPYLIPPKRIERALVNRARRGKAVTIVTNSLASNDMGRVIVSASISHYGRLMKAGVRIYESRGRTYHAKALLIDDRAVSVGSHNFTNHSHRNNGESNILTDSPDVISRMASMYESDIAGGELRLVTPQDLIDRSRSLGGKLSLTIGTWLRRLF